MDPARSFVSRPLDEMPSYLREDPNPAAQLVPTVRPVSESEITLETLDIRLNELSMLELRASEPPRARVRLWSDLTDSDSGFSDAGDSDDTVSLSSNSESSIGESSSDLDLDAEIIANLLAETESLIAQIQFPRFNEALLVRVQRQIEENKDFLEEFEGLITHEYRNLQYQNSVLERLARNESSRIAQRITRLRFAGEAL